MASWYDNFWSKLPEMAKDISEVNQIIEESRAEEKAKQLQAAFSDEDLAAAGVLEDYDNNPKKET